jgi:hypothetical protein
MLNILALYDIYNQHIIFDHNYVTYEVWSLNPKDGYQFFCQQITPLDVKT